MPDYILNRNYLHRSTQGFTIKFEKGQPVYVPPACEREVAAFGAERVEGATPSALGDEVVQTQELDAPQRIEAIIVVIRDMVERNDSRDFTGAGVPNVKAVDKKLPFSPDKSEVLEAWAEFNSRKSEEEAE